VASDGLVYTMYRPNEKQEAVIALDAARGATVSKFAYDAPFTREYVLEQRPGPRGTPLVSGDRLFAAGATGIMHALGRKPGKLLWSSEPSSSPKLMNGAARPDGKQDPLRASEAARGRRPACRAASRPRRPAEVVSCEHLPARNRGDEAGSCWRRSPAMTASAHDILQNSTLIPGTASTPNCFSAYSSRVS
jgi:hypothetical protein